MTFKTALIALATQALIHGQNLFIQDPELIKGELQNGFTYFIKHNSFDKEKASLRLVVNAGSINEIESERGLAHFVEHMVFRGSENFKDQEVIKFLESIGASFGAHTNAYTSFDQTVYMFDIPISNLENLEKGLKILSEFAFKASLNQKEIDQEKGVVLDEMRQRESATVGRLSQRLCEILLEGSLYEKRLPIGLETVIKDCSEEKMRSFYKKWYRPNNMALIAVGDFESEKVNALIEKYFGQESNHEVIEFQIPNLESYQLSATIEKNPDMFGSFYFIASVLEPYNKTEIQGYITSVVDEMILSIMNRRFAHLASGENSPFQGAFVYIQHLIKYKMHLMLQLAIWDKKPHQALTAAIKELENVVKYRVSDEEIELVKNKWLAELENSLHQIHQRHNPSLCDELVDSFVKSSLPLSKENEIELTKMIIHHLNPDMIETRKDELLDIDSLKILFFPSDQVEPINNETILSIVDQARQDQSERKVQEIKTLSEKSSLDAGEILESNSYKTTAVEEMFLENGMRVVFLNTEIKKESLEITLFANNGSNIATQQEYPSAAIAFNYMQKSGLSGLSKEELSDALSGKKLGLNYQLAFNRVISGNSSKKDIKILFKLLQSLFSDRTSSQKAFHQQKEEIDQEFATFKTSSDLQFAQLLSSLNSDNHYSSERFDSSRLNLETTENFLETFFQDPSEFTLLVVGDIDKDVIKNLCKEYLAKIEKKGSRAKACFNSFTFPEGITQMSVLSKGSKEESLVVLVYPFCKCNLKPCYRNFFLIDMIEDILTRRCLERLRIEKGETYGVSAQASFPFYPDLNTGRLYFVFSCAETKYEEMKSLILNEIKNFMEGPILNEEIDKAFEIYKHKEAKNLLSLSGIKNRLFQNILFESSFDHLIVDDETDSKPTEDEIRSFFKGLIDLNHYGICKKEPGL